MKPHTTQTQGQATPEEATIERTPEDTLRFERDMARIELSRVTKQRDELLEACKMALALTDDQIIATNATGEIVNAFAFIHVAINKAEGRQ